MVTGRALTRALSFSPRKIYSPYNVRKVTVVFVVIKERKTIMEMITVVDKEGRVISVEFVPKKDNEKK